jgi:MSHA biogenesis protein MshP
MCLRNQLQKQTGAGLPVALFIVTVLSLIVLSMSQLQESSGNAISLQIQSQRAFFAAESGAQVGVAKTLASEDCSVVHGERMSFTNDGLQNCQSDLSCSSEEFDIEGDSLPEKVFTVTSIGQCGSGQDAASRTVEVRVR